MPHQQCYCEVRKHFFENELQIKIVGSHKGIPILSEMMPQYPLSDWDMPKSQYVEFDYVYV